MPMLRSRRRIRHALSEIAYIVIGVLIALAMNSWWQKRSDRERERHYLLQLLEDNKANEYVFTAALRRDSLYRTRALRISQVLRSRTPLPPTDSLVSWHAWGGTDFFPQTGALDALLRTGDLRLLQSDSVRIAVTAMAAYIDGQRQAFDNIGEELVDVMTTRTERMVAHHIKQGTDTPASDPRGLDIAWQRDINWDAYRQDALAQAAVQRFTFLKNNNIGRYNSLISQTRAFRALLERELAHPR